ncbi:hypothetical protein JAAARDRAFT_188922 [Jaapia argillacea MUCL 33604]|uniref:RING-type domain-containing protein n=1 Tax=Jaapia argillacea MUCL 33604 TaxID=933084 RepID=A0A067Q8M0_9AGAM|nr:hypothetical protein JAAARDRAFT_188922 [Jaapia argillacea MUCL 33604]
MDEFSGYCCVEHGREAVQSGEASACVICERNPQSDQGFCLSCADLVTGEALGISDPNGPSTSNSQGRSWDASSSLSAAEAVRIAEIESQNEQLTKYKSLVSHFQESLTCQICSEIYKQPCSLSPCGHIVCYPCLFKWFTAAVPEGEDPSTFLHMLNKTCPYCRSAVSQKPAEVWNMKAMVQKLVSSGLMEGESSEDGHEGLGERTGNGGDPWKGIFG